MLKHLCWLGRYYKGDNLIPLSIPEIRGNEWKYIKECLDTNWVSYCGTYVDKFEKYLAEKTGSRYAVAVSSGTAALHLCLIIAGVQPDDEVIMPCISFVSPANTVRYCNAWPLFIDISKNDWQIDINKLSDFLKYKCFFKNGQLFNKETKRKISAIIAVHLLGGMYEVDNLANLAQQYSLPLIEDAAECLGATYKNKPIGKKLHGINLNFRLVITSFNGNKIITTGGGGAVLSNDLALAKKVKHLSTTAKVGDIDFFHDEVGYNYRMTNIAAAMGVAQLEKLDEFVEIKRIIAQKYNETFSNINSIIIHKEPEYCKATFWMYTIMLDQPSFPVIEKLRLVGIMVRPIWIPIYKLPAFKKNCMSYKCEFAEQFYQNAMSLPCSVGLKEKEQTFITNFIKECV